MLTLARLESRALVRVSGPDWRSFLQGLITNDVEDLGVGEARFAALLTPQGKFLADMFVVASEDGALLDVQAIQRDDLIRRLTIYRLRAKVEIAADDRPVFAAFSPLSASPANAGVQMTESQGPQIEGLDDLDPGVPPESGIWVADPRLAELGWRGYGEVEADAGEDAYHAHRLTLGVPDPARDCIPDRTYPIEADCDLLNGIDFKKGCFVGQETTSRMKRRGQIKNRMLPLTFDGPPPAFGAEVLAGDLRAGEVLSGDEGRAMALLRLDRIDGSLTVEGRPVEVARPSWFTERSST